VGELRDSEPAERLAFEEPDEYLRRREFLGRLAMLAGMSAGMGLLLDPETLVAEAAARQRKVPLPSPRNMPIDTFVVLMMENRSFDHYLGWLPGADGRQAGLSYTDASGRSFQTHRLTPDFQGCAFLDPDHSWQGGRTQLDGGQMDGFLRAQSDVFSIGYYAERDLPFIPSVARAFTTYDRFFCSLLASTYPNREYMHAAQSYGMIDNSLPPPPGFPDSTIFHALSQQGVSNRYFFTDLPVAALWGAPGLARSGHVQEYYERCAHGTLPALSFVDPQFEDEDSGTSGDEHPHGDVRAGQAFMADVVHAFMESPQWKRGALFIVYDEWGGFFDHVLPPRVPDIRSNPDINLDFGQMGIRIPAVTVSPWVRRGHVDHTIYGFESILKMIEYRFGLGPLTVRDKYARNIARSFDFESKPRLDPPHLPDPAAVMSHACQAPVVGQPNPGLPLPGVPPLPVATQATRRKPHDLAYLQSSGYLERLGFHYRPATAETTFRHPSQVRGK
jgi:phospholipase C